MTYLPEDVPMVRELIEHGASQAEPYLVAPMDTATHAVFAVPDGYHITTEDLAELRAEYRDYPLRKRGRVTAETVDSLVAYHNKHATDGAEVWVSAEGHVASVLNADDTDLPGWGDHRITLALTRSAEFKRWESISGQLLDQDEFAEYLEAGAADVATPDMATILEVARSLQATSKVDFESAYRTSDGQRAFKYVENTSARAGRKGELEIPERVTLSLRVYRGEEPQGVAARFRYRLSADGLKLGIVIERIDEIMEAAQLAVANRIAGAIERGTVLMGRPRP